MSNSIKESSENEMTFFEHIDALRVPLMRGAFCMFAILIVAFVCKSFVIDTILFGPQSVDFPTNIFLNHIANITGIEALRINQMQFNMVNTSMAGQFNLHFKISIITALVLAVPYILWELWRFVKPALTANERRGSRMFVFFVSLCFFSGLLFGYYVIAPLTINFLVNYTASPSIINMIDVNSYLSTVINVSLACAAVFQLPLLVFFLAKMGVITGTFMRRYRKHALMILVIFAAVITPPDVFSQVLVTLPLYGLYELSIRIADRVQREKERRVTE